MDLIKSPWADVFSEIWAVSTKPGYIGRAVYWLWPAGGFGKSL